MKFLAKCEDMRRELSYALNFTTKRNALSITSNILLDNNNNCLTIKATDQKNGFISSFPCETIVPGRTTVICEKLLDVLKFINGEVDLEISEENEKLSVKNSQDNSFLMNIRTISADKFPSLDERGDLEFFNIGQSSFFDMIDKTAFAVGKEETRHFLTGVFMERNEDGKLVMVATDGKRLACVKRAFEQEIPSFTPSILPVSFLNNLKSIGSGDGIMSIAIKDQCVYANIEGHYIYSLLVSGNYPVYQKVIPSSFEYTVTCEKDALVNAISLISAMIELKNRKVLFNLNIDGIMISGEDENGDIKNIVPCSYEGEEMLLSFNSQFLLESIKKIDSKNIAMLINSNKSAVGIISEPESDYIYIIMPMQN